MFLTRGLLLAGSLLWALAYPPLPLGFLAFFTLVPIFIGTSRLSPKRAFLENFLAGTVYNAVMYWWIYNVIAVGPAFIIGGGLVLLILYLSLFNGLLGWLFRHCLSIRGGMWVFPFLWAGLEALRAYGQMSFPWNNLGYTQGHYLPIIQSVRVLGTYGLSLIIVSVNVLLFTAWRLRGKYRLAAMAGAVILPGLLWISGSLQLNQPMPAAPALEIALVQPSIPQTRKWKESYFLEVVQKTFATMDNALGKIKSADLVVLPETAIPDFLSMRKDVIHEFQLRSNRWQKPILLGALDYRVDKKPWSEYTFYNAAFLFRPGRDKLLQYNKLRLVPFSEKLPFGNIFPVINYVNLGEGDFSEGEGHALWAGDTAVSPSICYEVIYPSLIREARLQGAKLLVNITNDGWFGISNAPYQHANIARFRAIETGAPMARCANTGVTVFYDYRGRILGKTRLMENTILLRSLPRYEEATFYLRHGDIMDKAISLSFWLGLGFLWLRGKTTRRR